jgi:hypothetical protein
MQEVPEAVVGGGEFVGLQFCVGVKKGERLFLEFVLADDLRHARHHTWCGHSRKILTWVRPPVLATVAL